MGASVVTFFKAAKARWAADRQLLIDEINMLTNALEARAFLIDCLQEDIEIERNRQIEMVQRTIAGLRKENAALKAELLDRPTPPAA